MKNKKKLFFFLNLMKSFNSTHGKIKNSNIIKQDIRFSFSILKKIVKPHELIIKFFSGLN